MKRNRILTVDKANLYNTEIINWIIKSKTKAEKLFFIWIYIYAKKCYHQRNSMPVIVKSIIFRFFNSDSDPQTSPINRRLSPPQHWRDDRKWTSAGRDTAASLRGSLPPLTATGFLWFMLPLHGAKQLPQWNATHLYVVYFIWRQKGHFTQCVTHYFICEIKVAFVSLPGQLPQTFFLLLLPNIFILSMTFLPRFT